MAQQVTNQIVDQLLDSIGTLLTQDDVESLHLVFDKLLLAALDIIDNGNVTRLQHPILPRNYCQVASTSSSLHSYTVFWDKDSQIRQQDNEELEISISSRQKRAAGLISYCPCPDFQIKMWASSEAGPSATPILMCKHLLAARIASKLHRVTSFTPKNEDEFLGTLIWHPEA